MNQTLPETKRGSGRSLPRFSGAGLLLRVVFRTALAARLLPAQDSAMRHRDQGQIDTTRIGVMSPMVLQQRLRLLGYSQISVVENVRQHARVNAFKGGRRLAVKYDPFTGKVVEASGRYERRREGVVLIRPDGVAVPPPT